MTSFELFVLFKFKKSTMLENAEKYFMTHRGIRTHDLDNTA